MLRSFSTAVSSREYMQPTVPIILCIHDVWSEPSLSASCFYGTRQNWRIHSYCKDLMVWEPQILFYKTQLTGHVISWKEKGSSPGLEHDKMYPCILIQEKDLCNWHDYVFPLKVVQIFIKSLKTYIDCLGVPDHMHHETNWHTGLFFLVRRFESCQN